MPGTQQKHVMLPTGGGEEYVDAVALVDSSGNVLLSAAALADATANPTVSGVGAFNEVWNGTTWDRVASGQADSLVGTQRTVLVAAGGTRLDAAAGQTDGATATRALWTAQSVYNGATFDRLRTPNVIKTIAAVAITAGTAATIWTPTSGKKFRLMGWSLSSSAAASLIFAFGGTPTVMFRTELLAAAGISQTAPSFGNGTMPGVANDVLKLDVSATSTVSGYVFGTEE